MTRAQEIASNLADVRARIHKAAKSAGRDPETITLVAVTKTFPESDIEILADLGITDVGESKEQEGSRKAAALSHLPLRWHFIGQLQRNKAARVAKWASVIQSVDRPELIGLLDSREVLLQINLDGQEGRGGVAPEAMLSLADAVVSSPLTLGGLMAVAPLGGDADAAFARLADLHRQLLAAHPAARTLSAGMSGDLEAAITHGATHVRIGSSILGSRPLLQ